MYSRVSKKGTLYYNNSYFIKRLMFALYALQLTRGKQWQNKKICVKRNIRWSFEYCSQTFKGYKLTSFSYVYVLVKSLVLYFLDYCKPTLKVCSHTVETLRHALIYMMCRIQTPLLLACWIMLKSKLFRIVLFLVMYILNVGPYS